MVIKDSLLHKCILTITNCFKPNVYVK